jgi:flagellar hook-length control protein FliK
MAFQERVVMRQSDPSSLFSLVARPADAKGLRAHAHAKSFARDRVEPFDPTLPTNEQASRPRAERRDIGGRDIGRHDISRRDDAGPREARASEACAHDAPKPERRLDDAKTEPKPCEDDAPKVEASDDQPVDAAAEATSDLDETQEADEAAAPGDDGASDIPVGDKAQPLILCALLDDAGVAAAAPQDIATPPQLADDGAEQDPEASPAPVQGLSEPGRARGVSRLVSRAVHAVIAAAGKGAAKEEPAAAPADAEESPSPDQHLGPQVSAAAKAAIEAAGKGQSPDAVAKLPREAPAREAAPDFQPADLKSADLDGPSTQTNVANAAHSAQSVRNGDRAAEGRGRPPVVHDVPLGAVPIEIGMRAMAGVRRFDIRLDPADLGRIDVRLDMGDDGTVKAHLTVDKVETLALLQRDARTLERAFEQAGLKPSDGGVDLTLRDHTFAGHRQGAGGEQQRAGAPVPAFVAAEQADEQPARILWRGTTGLDMRV